MTNSRTLFQDIVARISLNERQEEVRTIASMLLEKIFRLSPTDVLAGKPVDFSPSSQRVLEEYIRRINQSEPVQYVIGEALFYGRAFKVTPAVLIPRPETEDVVRVVLAWKNKHPDRWQQEGARILDIGTGSGCIAITLALEWPSSEVYAIDVSAEAIEVATKNASHLGANVRFVKGDVLLDELSFDALDILVSNPPYVTESEKSSLAENVFNYEPHTALFVPDNDPLLFYRAIAKRSRGAMKPGGLVVVEINERFGREVQDLFVSEGWNNVELIPDIAGKPRIVSATL
jgi:release factor glutamine methyltransferase